MMELKEKVIQELKDLLDINDPDISIEKLFSHLNELIKNDTLEIPLAFSHKINAILATK